MTEAQEQRIKAAASQFPLLTLSSGSEEEDENRRQSSFHSVVPFDEAKEKDGSGNFIMNKAALQALTTRILSHHHPYDEERNDDKPVETQSCFSSPGNTNLTFREKLAQRRDLIIKTSPIPEMSLLENNGEGESFDNECDSSESDPPPPPPPPHSRTGTQVMCNVFVVEEKEDTLTRLKRQTKYGQPHAARRASSEISSSSRKPPRRYNRISLHIYDLIAKDTLMQLPWGCVCEIGKCFNDVNSALHELGTGAYHVGIEINGIEYAYGATSQPNKSGIFQCIPKASPGYQYRTSINFGDVPLVRTSWVVAPEVNSPRSTTSSASSFRQVEEFIDGRRVIREMTSQYLGIDYHILRKNCCTFAHDACLRLGVPSEEIPSWFRNLAETGKVTSEMATASLEPLHKVLSFGCEDDDSAIYEDDIGLTEDEEPGFEIIAKRNATGTRDVVVVMDAEPNRTPPFRRTATWAY